MQLRTRWRERINRVKCVLLFIWYPCLLVSTIFFILSERLAVFFFTNSYNVPPPRILPNFLLLPLRERAWNPSDFPSCRLSLAHALCFIQGLQILAVTCIFLKKTLLPDRGDFLGTTYIVYSSDQQLAVRRSCKASECFRLVFLNRRATARYRALVSITPGRERFSWNLSF